MKISGCAYKELDETEKFFVTVEHLFCGNCGSPQERTGLVVFGGHLQSETFCGDVLVWTKPLICFYCDFIIRDLVLPCGDYVLELEYDKLANAI